MDDVGIPAWLDQRDLRRARSVSLQVHGDGGLLHHVLPGLQRHGIDVLRAGTPIFEKRGTGVAALCISPAWDTHAESMAEKFRRINQSFCVILPPRRSGDRLAALGAGARDVISAGWSEEEVFTRVVRLLADEALLTRARSVHVTLRNRLSLKNRLLDETKLEMVHRLGRAAEFRDNETGQHVIRVGKFCEIVGNQLRIPTRTVRLLRHAAPLHDIGKIGVADSILLKKAPLALHEWEIMKQHTVIGAEILGGTENQLLEMARIIALTHHERWDGKGYPGGLSQTDIPLYGRIAAVCDVYDALTSDRPYKRAWPHDDAIGYLVESRGSHFDPEVVDAFMASLDEVRKVREDHSDDIAPANVYRGGDPPDLDAIWLPVETLSPLMRRS